MSDLESNKIAERRLFTFQSNGESHGKRLVEATTEHLRRHEAPVGPEADKRSWFGSEEELPALFATLGMPQLDLEGVLAGLRVNRVETREAEVDPTALDRMGFRAAE